MKNLLKSPLFYGVIYVILYFIGYIVLAYYNYTYFGIIKLISTIIILIYLSKPYCYINITNFFIKLHKNAFNLIFLIEMISADGKHPWSCMSGDRK